MIARRPKITPQHPKMIPGKPLTSALMRRITKILNQSHGKLTRKKLAAEIGKSYQETIEYLCCGRSTPHSETTLKMARWADKNEPKK